MSGGDLPFATPGEAQTDTRTPRPKALSVMAGNIPAELKQLNQWVTWKYELRDDKWTKPPCQVNGFYYAKSSDPATWGGFQDSLKTYEARQVDGIGVVLTVDMGIVGVDLDHCYNPQTKSFEPWATKIIEHFSSYTEASPSRTGVRIFLKGKLPAGGRKKGNTEIYSTGRYLTVTGHMLRKSSRMIEPRQSEIDAFLREYFPPEPKSKLANCVWHPSDDELLDKAFAAKNGDKLKLLFLGDVSGYPSQSEADLALCSMLAFWAADEAQLDRVFRRSGLMRDKWDQKHGAVTYGEGTIAKAWAGRTEHYSGEQLTGKANEHEDSSVNVNREWEIGKAECENSSRDHPGKRSKAENEELKIETLGDLWAKEIPERESFLGDGLIARGDTLVFSGPQKKGKSLACLNLALCLAKGESWLGFSVPKAIRVGIVQQEIPEVALKERLHKMIGSSADVSFLDSIPHLSKQGLKLDTKSGIDLLRKWLDSAKVDLLQLDPLYTFHTGDENSPKDMARVFSPLQEIITEYGLASMVIHHHGKPSNVEREGGDLHRGTSLLRDVTDANWTFTRVPANKLALNEPPSHYVYLNFEQRHSAAPDPILLHLDSETLWLEQIEAKEVREVKVEEIIDEIRSRDGNCLQDDLIEAMKTKLGAKERSTRDAIYEARDKGLIEAGNRGRKRLWILRKDDLGE